MKRERRGGRGETRAALKGFARLCASAWDRCYDSSTSGRGGMDGLTKSRREHDVLVTFTPSSLRVKAGAPTLANSRRPYANGHILSRLSPEEMRFTGRSTVVGITLLPPIAEGSVVKTCDTNGDGRVGAVVVDVGTDQHQALQNAERKAGT
eukprot:scaffold37808_cov47-Phaeocystis_antarctica.AAC.2